MAGNLAQVIIDLAKDQENPLAAVLVCARMFLFSDHMIDNLKQLPELFKFLPALIGPKDQEKAQLAFDVIKEFFDFVGNVAQGLQNGMAEYDPDYVLRILVDATNIIYSCITNLVEQSGKAQTEAARDVCLQVSHRFFIGFFDNFFQPGDQNGSAFKQLYYRFDNIFPETEIETDTRANFKEYLRLIVERRKFLHEQFGKIWRDCQERQRKRAEFTEAALRRAGKMGAAEEERAGRSSTSTTGTKRKPGQVEVMYPVKKQKIEEDEDDLPMIQ